jgi:hypothetical protein
MFIANVAGIVRCIHRRQSCSVSFQIHLLIYVILELSLCDYDFLKILGIRIYPGARRFAIESEISENSTEFRVWRTRSLMCHNVLIMSIRPRSRITLAPGAFEEVLLG